MKRIINKYTLTIVGIGLFFLLWYLIFILAGSNIYVFPDPASTIKEAFSYFSRPYIYKCIWGSLYRMLIGFSIAAVLGIAIGMAVGNYIKIKYVFKMDGQKIACGFGYLGFYKPKGFINSA